MSVRGKRKTVKYWAPLFILGVFQNNWPENRSNERFELVGMTTEDNDLNGYIVNNGDVVVFNNAGELIEVEGDVEQGSGGGGAATATLWNPTVTTGQFMSFKGVHQNFNPSVDIEFSNASSVLSLPRLPSPNDMTGCIALVEPALNGIDVYSGFTFTLPNPIDIVDTVYFYIGFFSEAVYPEAGSKGALAVITVNTGGYVLAMLGNPFGMEGGANDFGGTPVPLSFADLDQAEITIAFDPTDSTYGTLMVLTSNAANTIVASHEFTSDMSDVLYQAAGYINSDVTVAADPTPIVLEINNQPTVIHTDLIQLTGGVVDTTDLPTDREGTLNIVGGLVAPTYYPGKGLLKNNDMVGWDLAGDLAGVLQGRNETVEMTDKLSRLTEYHKSMVGAIHFTPAFLTDSLNTYIEYEKSGGSNAVGMDATSVITETNDLHETLYRTGKLMKGSTTNLRGMFFTLPSTVHADIDVSVWDFGFADYDVDAYFNAYGLNPGNDSNSIKLTLNYSNANGWLPAAGFQPGIQIKKEGSITQTYANINNGDFTWAGGHAYFLGFSDNNVVLANLVTEEIFSMGIAKTFINQSTTWCWITACQVNHAMMSNPTVNTKIFNESFLLTNGFLTRGYVAFNEPVISNKIDPDSKPVNVANRSVQWIGIGGSSTIENSSNVDVPVANNSIVMYNSQGEISSIIQGF